MMKQMVLFTELQKVSTLPADYDAFNGGAAIVFLLMAVSFYASNRGHNSIVVYAVSENGEAIERIHQFQQKAIFQEISIWILSEDFVVVANQDSDNLTLYRRNQETGLLENDSKKMLPFPNVFVFLFV